MTMALTNSPLALHGGPPAAKREWPTWPVWDDAERRGLMEVLESGKWWFGQRVRQFEEAYAALHRVKFGISCTNGTTALEIGLRAMGIVRGDEVIIPPYTFVATASAVVTACGSCTRGTRLGDALSPSVGTSPTARPTWSRRSSIPTSMW